MIVGGMFSGKTEELIRRIRRAQLARQVVQVFKPRIDDRYSIGQVTSHDHSQVPAQVIDSITEIWDYLSDKVEVVAIDEAQFFNHEIVSVCQQLADRGLRVLVAGLDTDWKGTPFDPLPSLMAVAEVVSKQHAVCVVCGAPASRTQKISAGQSRVEVGGATQYESRCRMHFTADVATATKITEMTFHETSV